MIDIVYDVDGVLNNLNEYVANELGLPIPSRYNIRECTEYTKEEQDSILRMYRDPEVFRNLTFVSGADKICDIEQTGMARVWINSCNLNREIAFIKMDMLLNNIPGLQEDRVILQDVPKDVLRFADFSVEDCYDILMKYPAHTHKILIDKPYNREDLSKLRMEEDYTRVSRLEQANNLIWEYVELML